MGEPWLELLQKLENETPGTAKALIGSFQDDFYEKVIAALALVYYAETTMDEELAAAARQGLAELAQLVRLFGKLVWEHTDPAALAERVYEVALLEAEGGFGVPLPDFNAFARAEAQIAYVESLPDMPDTQPAALRTDEEIKQLVDAELAGKSGSVQQRYKDAYGDVPPLRRAGEGYEARTFHEGAVSAWVPVANKHHQVIGGLRLLEALPLCTTTPAALDCTWAKLGCARPDLDGNGLVDAADQALFDQAAATHQGTACGPANGWCGAADLDRTGTVDATDAAFMAAAQGCRYDVEPGR
jgi:hypothetical protein